MLVVRSSQSKDAGLRRVHQIRNRFKLLACWARLCIGCSSGVCAGGFRNVDVLQPGLPAIRRQVCHNPGPYNHGRLDGCCTADSAWRADQRDLLYAAPRCVLGSLNPACQCQGPLAWSFHRSAALDMVGIIIAGTHSRPMSSAVQKSSSGCFTRWC